MKMQSSKYLLGTASVLALFAASAAVPAHAQIKSSATKALYFGGSTLASEAFRQIFDCYTGGIVGYTTAYSDGYQFSTAFPAPGLLPTTCTTANTVTTLGVNGLYSGVGSGNGLRGYLANNPQQWYGGTATVGSPGALPAVKPPFIDYSNTGSPVTVFGSYPYPRVDVGMSDSPLPTTLAALTTVSFAFSPTQSWSTTGGTSPFTATGSGNVTYNPTAYGAPIQLPAFEVNVAIPVNTQGLNVLSAVASSGSAPWLQSNQGAAIQLTAAQLCAIFSGLVTDWSNTTANNIPYLDSAGAQQLAAFHDANKNSSGVSVPYATSAKPINIVYRSDGSGTSFILTNYLKAVCPLLDPANAKGYVSIFGAANLPSTSFANLITNITAFRGAGPWTPVTGTWVPANGSAGVASNVSDSSGTDEGRIGYVSSDFTRPYTTQVPTTTGGTVGAPYSAALQNEQLRIAGTYLPNQATAGLEFIAPTPFGAETAWGDTRLVVPNAASTWNDYNIYGQVFAAGASQGGVSVAGRSILPLNNRANAYPLSGTAFMFLYTCYSVTAPNVTADRVTSLTDYLNWHFPASTNALLTSVIQNNGFNPVPPGYVTAIRGRYLSSLNANRISRAGTGGSPNCVSAAGAI